MFHCSVINVPFCWSASAFWYYHIFLYLSTSFLNFFSKSYLTERRRRDLNPRTAINDLLPFQGSPFSRLGTSPNAWFISCNIWLIRNRNTLFCLKKRRRGWDSNPCALSDKRFSRPPRYDHFATSPVSIEAPHLGACRIIPSLFLSVKPFFSFFWFFQIFLLLIHFMM